ncbi:MAG: winged helix-turn-helix transcriptional regulator [Oceanicaulis sp.]|uniref:MarR family winged helix-turn-helix transcriptional regulator n=1 Tax=Glycocaulis sp. TaxID=1969725 RepID=UPI0025B96AF6|nr:MarR family winged helix-turn-helix transcriptional regulator [Glycocaulis sp.]MCC5982013.1 winged helix-turn-helix transcriptional regulator [Oceanicaulis sp.]MCH8520986.1 MarR family winged helix-turn-helix transcriptional regulator [Glycocaulis sp.]
MAESKSFDLAASPGQLLHRAQQFASEQFSTATGGVEITQRQFALLSALSEEDGQTQTALVQRTGIDRSTLAELVSRMATKGLVARERAPGDARANAVKLTDEGRALYATAIAGAAAADEAILSALPKNKRANFVEALMRISRALDPEADPKAKKSKKDGKDKKKKKKKKK